MSLIYALNVGISSLFAIAHLFKGEESPAMWNVTMAGIWLILFKLEEKK